MLTPEIMKTIYEAHRQEQLGNFSESLKNYRLAMCADPHHPWLATQYFRLLRDLQSDGPRGITIVWQIDPVTLWEGEWLRTLLQECAVGEIVDGHHSVFKDGSIIVDHQISSKRAYYFELLKRGCRFVLFHLSDEFYADDCTAYGFANFILRNYWSRAHAGNSRVLTVPLGYMTGFRAGFRKIAAERKYSWCFAGNTAKPSRVSMVQAMTQLPGGFLHESSALNPHRLTEEERHHPRLPLSIEAYAQVLSDSVFAPCPAGWENLDSFRVYEALEAGCIPIVERRENFDYFRLLLGEHPMLTIDHWHEAPALIRGLCEKGHALEAQRMACMNWWRNYKSSLANRVREHVLRSLSPGIRGQ